MNEKRKIGEACFFYSKMVENNNHNEFTFYLSAFLSSARSVLQYALEEAQGKSGGQAWYDNHISSSKILSHFKDKRDVNIHEEPVNPNRNISIEESVSLSMSESIKIALYEEGEEVEEKEYEYENKPTNEENPETTVESHYSFEDWEGSESVIELCKKYIIELQKIVDEGINQGFISG
ncbi:hypothetical protein [Halanaerobaculum tunisiense]